MSYYEHLADGKTYHYFKKNCTPNTDAHFHSAVEFLFVESGTQDVLVNGQRRTLYAGDACFADSFQVHAYPPTQGACVTVIVGNKTCFDNIFQLFEGKVPPTFFRFDDFALLEQVHGLYAKNLHAVTQRYPLFVGSMHILVGKIAENTQFVCRETTTQDSLICDILRYAEKNLGENLCLQNLSTRFGYSREHISRLLNKYLLENWTSYLNRLRVRLAHKILQENPSLTVLDVAFSCGFDSANTFYRSYKKEFGHPPKLGK